MIGLIVSVNFVIADGIYIVEKQNIKTCLY